MKEVYTKPKLNIIIDANPQDDARDNNILVQNGGNDIIGGGSDGGFDGGMDE
jgi:hypothetical protein